MNRLHSSPQTLVDVLRKRSIMQPDRLAYTFLNDGVQESGSFSYSQLDQKARAIAVYLRNCAQPGDRILMWYPSGLDFIAAFFGCLYANMIAVPAYPPKPNKSIRRLQAIISDADSHIALTNRESHSRIQNTLADAPGLQSLQLIVTDEISLDNAEQWQSGALTSDRLAFLQYTSGSTGSPKGVMVTHENLMANCEILRVGFNTHNEDVSVIWLPNFHDMGLIEGILHPLYTGYSTYLMPPVAFIQNPLCWLEAISRYRGTHQGSPNFGYDMCARKATPEFIETIDLSCWRTAYCGSEPIRKETADTFIGAFAGAKLRPQTFFPCYGLAEATLMVTANVPDRHYVHRPLSSDLLEKNIVQDAQPSDELDKIRNIISCGHPVLDTKIVIANPESMKTCGPDEVGEIWISGNSIARGYLNRPQITRETFDAYLVDTHAGPFLRTGDLGFLHHGELYITGRLKDVIIIRGKNHYPQDIEYTVANAHADLRHSAGSSAAFSIEVQGCEQLVVVQEVERAAIRNLDIDAVVKSVSQAVAAEHDIQLYALILIKPASILKTSSGKIERNACRQAYLNREFQAIAEWCADSISLPKGSNGVTKDRTPSSHDRDIHLLRSRTIADERLRWIQEYATTRINSRLFDERRCFPPYLILDLGNQGLLGMQVSQKYGGLELGYRDSLRIVEQLGSIDLSLGLLVGLNNILGIRPIQQFGSPKLQEELLPRLAQGRELGAFSLTEPSAGSNPRSIQSYALSDANGGWRLYGHKIWSGSASWAGVLNVFVNHQGLNGSGAGMSGFVVRQGSAGLHQGPEALTMGMRGMVQNEFTLDGVQVDEHSLLGTLGEGFAVANDAMSLGRVALGALSLGGMKRCLQLMRRYATRRTVSTGKLFDNPYTRFSLATQIFATDALDSLVTRIGELMDKGVNLPPEIHAACKINGPEMLWNAVDNLTQLLGGRGFIETNLVPQMLRDARIFRVFEGPTETLMMFIGQNLLNQNSQLIHFIAFELQSPATAERLRDVIQGIQDRWVHSSNWFDSPMQRRQHACMLIGKVFAAAMLWAVVENDRNKEQTCDWARGRFEALARSTLSSSFDESGLPASDSIHQFVDIIDRTLGDIEQTLPGENQNPDPYLRKNETTTKEAAFQALDMPVKRKSSPQKNFDEILKWIQDWFEQTMHVSKAHIHLGSLMSDLGVDSLKSIQFSLDFGNHIGRKLDENFIWEYPTIRELIQSVSSPTLSTKHPEVEQPLNLEVECMLNDSIVFSSLPQRKKTNQVFLTGATGFLGAYLLHELLEQSDDRVHCLVRAKSAEAGMVRIIQTLQRYSLWRDVYLERISVVPGDLSKPRFDLSPQCFDRLAHQVDAVYHNAAQVNFIAHYPYLKAVNVDSTKDVLRLATTGILKPVHHISTIAVFESDSYARTMVDETNPVECCSGMEMGYSQSKWVAEQLIRQAGNQGVPVCIYRPPLISGDSRNGIWNTDDFTCRYIKGCIEMCSFPELDFLLDVSPVDYVSRAVVYLSRQSESYGQNFHLSNPHPWHWSQLGDWLIQNGYPVTQKPYQQWVADVQDQQNQPESPLYALRPFYIQKRGKHSLAIPQMYEQDRRPVILTDKTQDALRASQIVCSPVSDELISLYFDYFVQCGFLHATPAVV